MSYGYGENRYPTKRHWKNAQKTMIKDVLDKEQLTEQGLAYELGVDEQTVKNWLYETGRNMNKTNYFKLVELNKGEPEHYTKIRVSKYTIGEVLGEVMEVNNLDSSYVAKRLGRSEETVKVWSRGGRAPIRKSVDKIEGFIGNYLEKMVN